MKKPIDRKRSGKHPSMATYKLLYGRIDKPPPNAPAQPKETPPPTK